MSTDRPRNTGPDSTDPQNAPDRAPDEPIVTDAPSSHQSRTAPPAGSEPQGRTTMIAAIVALVVIVLIILLVFL